jgi:hypothetical protein
MGLKLPSEHYLTKLKHDGHLAIVLRKGQGNTLRWRVDKNQFHEGEVKFEGMNGVNKVM